MNLVWSDSKKHIKSAKYQEFRGAMIQSALDDIQTLLKPAEGLFCILIKFMGLILGKLGPGQSGPAKLSNKKKKSWAPDSWPRAQLSTFWGG